MSITRENFFNYVKLLHQEWERTTQSVIARLESEKTLPSMKTLHRYAETTGNQVHLTLTH